MTRLTTLLLALLMLTACGETDVEYELSSDDIDKFLANAEMLSARDDHTSPIAMSVLASNQVGAPESVQIWNPDELLYSVGIRNMDLIALVDDKVPSRDYKNSFSPNYNSFANAAEQYVHFVSSILSLRETQDSVLLTVLAAEGSLHKKDAHLIRIVFR